MTPLTLVYGGNRALREQTIAAHIDPALTTTVIAEGMAGGSKVLETMAESISHLTVLRIAPACPCCIGQLTMRVTLNRLLRQPPECIYLSLDSSTHLQEVQRFLRSEAYQSLLQLAPAIDAGSIDASDHQAQ